MGFRLTPRSMTLDDLELLRHSLGICGISRIWERTTAKRIKIDPIVSDGIVVH